MGILLKFIKNMQKLGTKRKFSSLTAVSQVLVKRPKRLHVFENYGLLLKGIYPCENHINAAKSPIKVAGFDMDWTIIRTKTGKTFPKSKDDWLLLFDDCTKNKMRDLHDDGYHVVVFTN